ncbi:hypothetical protein [Amycolatopsis sp. cg9]
METLIVCFSRPLPLDEEFETSAPSAPQPLAARTAATASAT